MKTPFPSLNDAAESRIVPRRFGRPLTPSSFGRVLDYNTRQKLDFVNLTDTVEQLVAESGIRDGFALVQSLHSTVGLIVNEWQDALLDDLRTVLEQTVREDASWRHNDPRYSDCERSNATSHLRAAFLSASAFLGVRDGRLVRGTWQSIILVELDGPRTRSVSLQVLGG